MPLQEELKTEVLDMAKKVGTAGFNLLVIDTENKFVSTGFAEEIAKKALVRTRMWLPVCAHSQGRS
jgi:magnesium chelatase subunit D